jgi:hypothetical protein
MGVGGVDIGYFSVKIAKALKIGRASVYRVLEERAG